jgi:hypothetical protein
MAGQLTSTTLLQGGLNLVTPAISVPAGMAIAGVNYEPEVRGYRRIGGYERYDGRPRPSQAQYWVLRFEAATATIDEGDVITGATSGATAIALRDAVLSGPVVVPSATFASGLFDTSIFDTPFGNLTDGTGAGYVPIYELSGTFQDGETLRVLGSDVSVADGTAVLFGAPTDALDAEWRAAVAAIRRNAITEVPGSGPVRGVWTYGGAVYAFRDNTGGTAGVMHKSTTSGWAAQSLGQTVGFENATNEWKEGDTLTQGSVTATIRRVVLQSGTYSGSDAKGYLTISGIAGGNFAAGAATSTSGAGDLTGAQVANALPPGGRYDFVNHRFFGTSERMYGCNGEGEAFEWDGTYFTPISTGQPSDKPTHIAEYSNHLFLGFATGALVYSGLGEPASFLVTGGAGEISFGAPVTGLLPAASTSLVVFGRNRVSYLTGKDNQDFQLVPLADDAGAVEWTAQIVGSPIYQDDAGVRRMTTTEAFGNWRMGTLTDLVFPIFQAKRRAGVNAVASIRVRAKDQYRLFFADRTGLTIYMGRERPEIIPFQYPFEVSCAAAGFCDCLVGNEQLYVGGTNGFVYQLDIGTSFDGAEINAFLRLPFNGVGSPLQMKRFHKATLEVDATAATQIAIVSDFSYGDPALTSGAEASFGVSGGGGFWDEARYDDFRWSSPVQGLAESYINGLGRNISIGVISDSATEEPHVLSALTLNFTYRGLVR